MQPKLSIQQSFRKLLIRNIVMPLLMGILSIGIFVFMISILIHQSKEVEKNNRIIAVANIAMKLMIDGETGLRGYVITANDAFLEPYLVSVSRVPTELDNLKVLFRENKMQEESVVALQSIYKNWHSYAENIKRLKDEKRDVVVVVSQGTGKAMMDEARALFDRIISREERVRIESTESLTSTTRMALVIVSVIIFVLSIIIAFNGKKQMTELAGSYEKLLEASREQNEILYNQQWIKTGQTDLSQQMALQKNAVELMTTVLGYLARYLQAQIGVFYLKVGEKTLERTATYAFMNENALKKTIRFGESLAGQAARDRRIIVVRDVPNDYLRVASSLGSHPPKQLIIIPLVYEDEVMGVIELGFLGEADPRYLAFFEAVKESLTSSLKAVQLKDQRERMLIEIQNQATELQTQQQELRVINEELEEQTRNLQQTQAKMEIQYAEIEQSNAQLEEQAQVLQDQRDELGKKNESLNAVRANLEHKALELQTASRYKSEFLANMSHELRTPLNSSLILAKLLADNKEKNLNDQQIEFAQQILSAGNDLLNLINDILDLSKVEAGKLEISPDQVQIKELINSLKKTFSPSASEKRLKLNFEIDARAPDYLSTDRQRIEQILKNLISNAIKFTPTGSVNVQVLGQGVTAQADFEQIQFRVQDTGIGIHADQHEVVFEAFRQADGTTNRKFGGTGLGLSISRDLARLLGGQITVQSRLDHGSTFTLTLPLKFSEKGSVMPSLNSATYVSATDATGALSEGGENSPGMQPTSSRGYFADDRDNLVGGTDRILLVAEDDEKFARILYELARENDYKCIVTNSAQEAITLAKKYRPRAIILDVKLNDQSGLFVLDQLKHHSLTRHIPVHVISGEDFSRQALHLGAIGHILKPVMREQLVEVFDKLESKTKQNINKVLIVEDNKIQSSAIQKLIEDKNLETVAVETGELALKQLNENTFDCMIMDLNLPDMSGFELIERMNNADRQYPAIIVYTGRSLTRDEEAQLNQHSRSVIIKGARSPERLLDEVTLFLHRVESGSRENKHDSLKGLRHRDRIFEDKVIMVVDDDMRNTFALTSALEQQGARVVIARNGQESLAKLGNEKLIDLVLMDIMMPVMDGYEAIALIRKNPAFKKLPVIALTAKAMKDDQQLCLRAGANDYLSKPIDLDKLVSLMRIWLTAGWV